MIPCPMGWFCSKDGLGVPDKLSEGGYVSLDRGRIDKDTVYKDESKPKHSVAM